MKRTFRFMLIFLMMLTGSNLYAADKPAEFSNPILKERYYSLIEEIRCLVCQNQSLADSHADLAQDLRNEIFQMIVSGEQDEHIIQFLVERYGDFVLYRPPLKENTWLLWFGPFLLLITALIIAVVIIRKQSTENRFHTEINESQQKRLMEILKETKRSNQK